jgi:hypothetical protein
VAHLAAGALVPDGAGFQFFRPFKGSLQIFLSGLLEQDLRGRVNGFKVFSHGYQTPFADRVESLRRFGAGSVLRVRYYTKTG